jgi:hypothetical protein
MSNGVWFGFLLIALGLIGLGYVLVQIGRRVKDG